VEFELVALDEELELPGIEFFSIPPAPSAISGPVLVSPGARNVEYSIQEIDNADSYHWTHLAAEGSSTSNRIVLNFDPGFIETILSVQAEKVGFGKGPFSYLTVRSDGTSVIRPVPGLRDFQMDIVETTDQILIKFSQAVRREINLRMLDSGGRILLMKRLDVRSDQTELEIDKKALPGGFVILFASSAHQSVSRKFWISK